jgi:hypothetical protein
MGIVLAGSAIAGSPNPPNLIGDYAITGTAACLFAPGSSPTPTNPTPGVALPNSGFDPTTLRPKDGHVFSTSFNVEGIATFNGDGTGTLMATNVSIDPPPTPGPPGTYPSFPPAASSDKISASFTYTVNNDGTFNAVFSVSGTFLTGGRTGQTFTVDTIQVTGLIGANAKTLTLATVQPIVETIAFSNGDVWPRICHRSRILVKISDGN